MQPAETAHAGWANLQCRCKSHCQTTNHVRRKGNTSSSSICLHASGSLNRKRKLRQGCFHRELPHSAWWTTKKPSLLCHYCCLEHWWYAAVVNPRDASLHREPGGGIEWFPLTGEYPSGSMWKSFTRKSHNVSVTRWYNSSASRSCVTHSMPPGIHDPEKKKHRRGIFALRMLLQILLSQICRILFWKYLMLSINILQQWVPAFNHCALSQHISLHLWPFSYCEK